MCAPDAIPAFSAIQPAWRPITSTSITRWCDSAVLCSRSIASVATWSAVSCPNVTSVQSMSLSMVFGTPTTGTFSSDSQCAAVSVPSPPIGISTSMPLSSSVCLIWSSPARSFSGLHARGAEHGAALGEQPVVAVIVGQLDPAVFQ